MNTYYHLSGEETMKEINGSTEPLTEEQVRKNSGKIRPK